MEDKLNTEPSRTGGREERKGQDQGHTEAEECRKQGGEGLEEGESHRPKNTQRS